MAERALITRPKSDVPERPTQDPTQELRGIAAQKKYFYRVGSEGGKEKKAPSAAMVFAQADEHGNLFYQILDIGKDAEKAWALVRAWEGPKDNPIRCLERFVCLRYDDDLTDANYRLIARGAIQLYQGEYWPNRQPKKSWYKLQTDDWKIDESGWPIVLNPYVKLEIMQEHQRFRRFAERTAQTQAIRAALLQLLDSSWDEEAEARADKSEELEPENIESPPMNEMLPPKVATQIDTRASSRTLGQLKSDIWNLILKVCDGQLPRAYAWLKEHGQIEGKPLFEKISDIPDDLEMVQEILARAEAAWRAKSMGVEEHDS